MMKAIWALPGFLGLSKDWELFSLHGVVGVDLHAFPMHGLTAWAMQFNDWIEKQTEEAALLMGYSLGGRLALHALLDRPKLWKGAIIISSHTGLKKDSEREERLKLDEEWAERFRSEEWGSLMQAWNEREVFAGDPVRFDRQEQEYQRELMSSLLIEGSLGKQADLRAEVSQLPMPLLWVTGKEDFRYCQIAREQTFFHPHSRHVEIPGAGHRAPWSQPAIFGGHVQSFLELFV